MQVIDFKNARCRNCYKCVRHCDVKAISVENAQARIIESRCINCGHCMEICPQNAKTLASDMERVKTFLAKGEKTVVSIAPAYLVILDFNDPTEVAGALLRLGFSEVRETAEGAAMVTNEYKKLIREKKLDTIITTCCPSMNDLTEKYYPDCTKYLAPVVSPMIAHGRYIKKLYGKDTRVVFLGPCIAKKREAEGDERISGAIDAILTFEEIKGWLRDEGIKICDCERIPFKNPSPEVNRLYPIGGGVITSVLAEEELEDYHKVSVDGLKNCMEMLEAVQRGELTGCFIEANVCDGGCIKGPVSSIWDTSYLSTMVRVKEKASRAKARELGDMSTAELARTFENRSVAEKEPTQDEIKRILADIGKYSEEDELNCGACGYRTCREKATAVYNGKAERNMCLPYAILQSESMSNVVLDVTPDIILIIGSDMKIRECNKRAQAMLGIGKEEALERYIFEFIEADDIEQAFLTRQSVYNTKIRLDDRVASRTIVYIKDMDCALVIYHDITREEKMKEQHYRFKLEAMEIAQKVIDKQMTAAQEIAGLLGETTAETKVTMMKLRDSILEDADE